MEISMGILIWVSFKKVRLHTAQVLVLPVQCTPFKTNPFILLSTPVEGALLEDY